MRDRYCRHCGLSASNGGWCYPCRKRRAIYGEAGMYRVQKSNEAGSWGGQLARWRANDKWFRDSYWRAVALATCCCGDMVVEELSRRKLRRSSTVVIRALSSSASHRGIVRKLAAGRAALATNNWCNRDRAKVVTIRTWRAHIAHFLRRQGAGTRRPVRCRDTIENLTSAVVRCEKEIEPFLLDVERRARIRVRESKRMFS